MQVRRNHQRQRFELIDEGLVAGFIAYEQRPEVVVLVDTEVTAHHERLGGSDFLVRKVFELLRREDRLVEADCPFVAAWLRRHPEFQDLQHDPNRSP